MACETMEEEQQKYGRNRYEKDGTRRDKTAVTKEDKGEVLLCRMLRVWNEG